jgi:hypothetical protein
MAEPHTFRRRFPRVRGRRNGEQLLRVQPPFQLRDISGGGFAIESPTTFRIGRAYRFDFMLSGRGRVTVRAVAVHCASQKPRSSEAGYIAGFAFTRTKATEATIDALVDAALAIPRPPSSI